MSNIKEITHTLFELPRDLQLHPDSEVIEKGVYRLYDVSPFFTLARYDVNVKYNPVYLTLEEFHRFMRVCFDYAP